MPRAARKTKAPVELGTPTKENIIATLERATTRAELDELAKRMRDIGYSRDGILMKRVLAKRASLGGQ